MENRNRVLCQSVVWIERLVPPVRFGWAVTLAFILVSALPGPALAQATRFLVSVPEDVYSQPLTGRLVLILGGAADPEPRLTLAPHGPPIFGLDLEALPPGENAILDDRVIGFPTSLAEMPPGEYFAQVVINVYEEVHRGDGHHLWLPMTDGTIQFFSTAPGNLYSDPQPVRLGEGGTVEIRVTNTIEAPSPPVDTEWLKHVRIQSDMLTEFWGRPVYIHATVLLPKGFTEEPDRTYPGIFVFGHSVPFSFTTDSTRVRGLGEIDPVRGVETGYDFYKEWNSEDFPRVVAVTLQQSTPFFADSYSINSANNGPYGNAIVQEVIPFLEERFRMIGEPHGRLVEGASTSGWQSLALQLHYPDFFGGAWILQPDPIDFRRHQLVDIYQDTNAFTLQVGGLVADRPFRRTVEGQVVWTVGELSLFEEVLGTKGRSGYQLEAWEAVYGPVGPDGYPVPLWDKLTGEIDRSVAEYWRDQGYDLREYAERNWATLGPKLAGKLHFFAGDMDDFYLNLAVYRFEEFTRNASNPTSDAEYTYGRPMKGHSWHAFPWAELVRRMAAHAREGGR